MSRAKQERFQKLFIQEFPDKEVHSIDCVPEIRPYNSWTEGVKAWARGKSSGEVEWIGWFHPPRLRNKKKVYDRIKPKGNVRVTKPVVNEERRHKEVRKHYIRVLRSRGYSMAESKAIVEGKMDLERNPILPSFEDSDEVEIKERQN